MFQIWIRVVLDENCGTVRFIRNVSPCNPIATYRLGDFTAPYWQRSGWWMMPCWTSLRGASHNRSFQKAVLAWGMAWKVISINIQSSDSAISKHNLDLRNIIVFLTLLHSFSSTMNWVTCVWWIWYCCHSIINLLIICRIAFGFINALYKRETFILLIVALYSMLCVLGMVF